MQPAAQGLHAALCQLRRSTWVFHGCPLQFSPGRLCVAGEVSAARPLPQAIHLCLRFFFFFLSKALRYEQKDLLCKYHEELTDVKTLKKERRNQKDIQRTHGGPFEKAQDYWIFFS